MAQVRVNKSMVQDSVAEAVQQACAEVLDLLETRQEITRLLTMVKKADREGEPATDLGERR